MKTHEMTTSTPEYLGKSARLSNGATAHVLLDSYQYLIDSSAWTKSTYIMTDRDGNELVIKLPDGVEDYGGTEEDNKAISALFESCETIDCDSESDEDTIIIYKVLAVRNR